MVKSSGSAATRAAVAMMLVGSSVAVLGTLHGFPVYLGQAVRFALAAAVLLAVLRLRSRRGAHAGRPVAAPPRLSHGQRVRVVVLAAVGMLGFNVVTVAAERHADPAFVGVVVGGAPVVVALLTPLLRRRAPGARSLRSAGVVAAGATLAQGLGGTADTLGLLLALGALAAEVTFALVAAPLLRDVDPVRVAAHACTVAAGLSLGAAVAAGDYARPDAGQCAALLWLGVIVTALAYVLWFGAVGHIGPERAALFTGLVPAGAVGVAALLGAGAPTLPQLAGAALVLAGLVMGAPGARRRAARVALPTLAIHPS